MEQETKKETTEPEPQNDAPQVLHTFKTDTSEYIREKGLSSIDVLGAEARKGKSFVFEDKKPSGRSHLFYLTGIFTVIILGLVAIVFLRLGKAPEAPATQTVEKPFLAADWVKETDLQNLKSALGHNTRVNTLLHIPIIEFQGEEKRHISAGTFFYSLSPYPPAELSEATDTRFMFAEFYFSGSSGVLIFKIKSFSHAVSGMFNWEKSISQSLSQILLVDFMEAAPAFKDKIVSGRDTRMLLGKNGDTAVIYSFIGRDYLVITTSEEALREVFKRLI